MVGLCIGHRVRARGRQKEERTAAGERREKDTISGKWAKNTEKTHLKVDAARPSVCGSILEPSLYY